MLFKDNDPLRFVVTSDLQRAVASSGTDDDLEVRPVDRQAVSRGNDRSSLLHSRQEEAR